MESYRVGQKGFSVGDAEEFVEMVAFDTAASHGAKFGRLIVSSLSPDYGRFWKEAWLFKKTHEGDDLSSIYLRDIIYSNIQGGLGIFGAMTSSETPFYGYYREN